jgi:23S rRNA (uridine2552-2'-O)-methyltransferase
MRHTAAKATRWEDHYTRLARKERYPARSVYKLQEIQKRFAVLRQGNAVLDLGCAPGSWLMYAAGLVGPSGCVVGVDLAPVAVGLPPHVSVHTKDVFELVEGAAAFFGREFDAVLSDMAPATTGSRGVDAARSHNLCEAALAIARQVLRPGGTFVCKIFQGEEFRSFTAAVKAGFSECKPFKPQSCRKASREIYLIGKGKTGGSHVRPQ